jgi:hypothetical protein
MAISFTILTLLGVSFAVSKSNGEERIEILPVLEL